MKKTILLAALGLLSLATNAQNKNFGYTVEVKFEKPIQDKKVYIAHYFGKGFPTIYKLDSADVVGGTKATFHRSDSILGGLHLVMYDNNSKFFHFLLDNGYTVKADVDTSGRAIFSENQINKEFEESELKMIAIQSKKNALRDQLKDSKKKSDSTKIQDKFETLIQEEKTIRRTYVATHPGNLLSLIFNAMDSPDIPKGKHYLKDGKTIDSLYGARYYKDHFWDKFDFTDNRLINTGLLEGRLAEYFNNYVYPIPDTINYEMDKLLKRAEPAKELYKYTLFWLGNWTNESKMMGVDGSFVYLVENYYGKGKAFWLDSAAVAKYRDRAAKIAPNVLGNPAPSLILQDLKNLQDVDLTKATNSDYTVIAFWSSDCGHCMEEMPKLAKIWNESLKKEGVQFISIPTKVDGGNDILKIYDTWKVNDWLTLVDAKNKKQFEATYDVYATPVIYILDKNKIIIGKKLGVGSVEEVIKHDKMMKKKGI